jgi:low temperature requirement protein LtrA
VDRVWKGECGVRLLHLVLYVDASRRGNASLAAISGFAITVAIGMALLVAGSFASESVRVPLWIAAAAIDYAGPAWLTRNRLRGLQRVAVAHFAERYSLFIIICLGESIVAAALVVFAAAASLTAWALAGTRMLTLVALFAWETIAERRREAAGDVL